MKFLFHSGTPLTDPDLRRRIFWNVSGKHTGYSEEGGVETKGKYYLQIEIQSCDVECSLRASDSKHPFEKRGINDTNVHSKQISLPVFYKHCGALSRKYYAISICSMRSVHC